MSFRAMPIWLHSRQTDANETREAWKIAIEERKEER